MGTNYFLKYNICKCCNRGEVEHIGKSSLGWTFTFHATESIKSYKDWLKELEKPSVVIEDEYNNVVSLDDFKSMVEKKRDSENNHAKICGGDSFLDEEGNSMIPYEFS